MSQRDSGYIRQERDSYKTPAWVTEALLPHLPRRPSCVWEPAAGTGKMADVLRGDFKVVTSDIVDGTDFLATRLPIKSECDAIVTNPPYEHAEEFIEHALTHEADQGIVAMLLRTDYDHAKGRQHLFGRCKQFAKKLVLTKRIIWFDRPGAAPSFNHAWYVWDWRHVGSPVLAYGPAQ